jgi:hypothetical protein
VNDEKNFCATSEAYNQAKKRAFHQSEEKGEEEGEDDSVQETAAPVGGEQTDEEEEGTGTSKDGEDSET